MLGRTAHVRKLIGVYTGVNTVHTRKGKMITKLIFEIDLTYLAEESRETVSEQLINRALNVGLVGETDKAYLLEHDEEVIIHIEDPELMENADD